VARNGLNRFKTVRDIFNTKKERRLTLRGVDQQHSSPTYYEPIRFTSVWESQEFQSSTGFKGDALCLREALARYGVQTTMDYLTTSEVNFIEFSVEDPVLQVGSWAAIAFLRAYDHRAVQEQCDGEQET
jgi:hypothetical protein